MKKSRWLPHPALSVLLTLLWLMLNNTLSAGHVVLGAVLGWGLPLLLRCFLIEVPTVRKPLLLCRFIALVFYDIVVANLHVAKLGARTEEPARPCVRRGADGDRGLISCLRY